MLAESKSILSFTYFNPWEDSQVKTKQDQLLEPLEANSNSKHHHLVQALGYLEEASRQDSVESSKRVLEANLQVLVAAKMHLESPSQRFNLALDKEVLIFSEVTSLVREELSLDKNLQLKLH